MFRTVPVFFTVSFVVVTSSEWNRDPWVAGGMTAGTCLALSYLPTLARARSRGAVGRRTLMFWFVSSVLTLGASVAAVSLRAQTAGLVPSGREMVTAVWLAAFIGVVSFRSAQRLSVNRDPANLLRRSRLELEQVLVNAAEAHCAKFDASFHLVIAIMVYENVQRPRWFRRLERLVGKVTRAGGTYGVMQVRSSRPIDDQTSIEIAAERLAGTAMRPNENGWDYRQRLLQAVSNYNSNPDFSKGVEMALDQVSTDW